MKKKYTISGVGDGVNYGVYEQNENDPPFKNMKLVATCASLNEAQKEIRKREKEMNE